MIKSELLIIGSGPAGLTAAIYASRGGIDTCVLTGDYPGGQPTITDLVENFPGFPDGIKGPELMNRVKRQAEKFGADIHLDKAKSIEKKEGVFFVKGRTEEYQAQAVIIATGASPRWLKVPGSEKFKGKGISVCATCDGPFYKGKEVAIVGGGDTALTEAEFLTKFADRVYVIHRRENYRAQQILKQRIKKKDKIVQIFNTEVEEFLGEKKLKALKLESKYQVNSDKRAEEVKKYPDYADEVIEKTENEIVWQLSVDGVFLAIGYIPNTEFIEDFVDKNDRGYVLTDQDVFTSVRGVFAAGDCVDYKYRQNIVASAMGAKAALEVENFLKENE
jgi:thioredoxin reductase (NADPH)